jgi:hypothetical protein
VIRADESGGCGHEPHPPIFLSKQDFHMNTETEKPTLKIIGTDGNAFAILGKASRVARANNLDWDAICKEATAGDYNHLLATLMEHFDVE